MYLCGAFAYFHEFTFHTNLLLSSYVRINLNMINVYIFLTNKDA